MATRLHDLPPFYVFVEDIDRFCPTPGAAYWEPLLAERARRDLPPADTIAWLDGVEAGYFASLHWPGRPCDPARAAERERRAEELRAMPAGRFRVFALLLSSASIDDGALLEQLRPSTWHHLSTGRGYGRPAYMLPDYEVDRDIDRPIVDIGECSDPGAEYPRLREAFSLNHLPDARAAR